LQDELESYFMIMKDREDGLAPYYGPIDHNTPGMGDIFIRHPFVRDAFSFLWNKYADQKGGLELAKTHLLAKWKEKGMKMFLDSMNGDSVYAGDLELAPLAKYFGINLDVDMGMRGNHSVTRLNRLPASIRLDDGSEYKLERSVCLKLSSRGIIDVERTLEPISHESVDQRLNAIPNHAIVVDYINTNKPVKYAPVPAEWSPECLHQLRQRGIITTRQQVAVFASDLSDEPADKKTNGKENRDETLSRIAAFPNAKEIAAAWKAVPVIPKMRLKNSSAVHWNNIVAIVVPVYNPSPIELDKHDIFHARAMLTKQFLNSRSYEVVDEVLLSRKTLTENTGDVAAASKVLLGYAMDLPKPEKKEDRYLFAVHFHTLLGLASWALAVHPVHFTPLQDQLRNDLSELAKKFPAEFSFLSDKEDWNLLIRPYLDASTAASVLASKLDRIEKVFKTYDIKKWRALVAEMHPSYIEAFEQFRAAKLSGTPKTAWHLWKPAPGEDENVSPVREMTPIKYRH
jgi:hypothetical protein